MFKNSVIKNSFKTPKESQGDPTGQVGNWKLKIGAFGVAAVFIFGFFVFQTANAAVLSLSPSTGVFTVGNTFDVSINLDTQNEAINTIVANLRFPADKLQLVSPTAGKSIIDIWLTAPKFNNQSGEIELKGGIPGGINVANGLITKLTFRVKAPGQAIVKFLDESRILLHDGKGTDALRDTQSGIYDLELPPPGGPIVVSPTHPDQAQWYPNPNAVLNWASDENVEAYSYILDKEAVTVPDDISEGMQTSVLYKGLSSGKYYFHIKAMRKRVWGGITHFMVNVDTDPPAEFPVEIAPSARTTRLQPVVQFQTTDAASGIDHYELKIIPLRTASGQLISDGAEQPFFIEVESPYVTPQLELGSYDVIVRAYDKAKNYRESVQNLKIVSAVFRFIGDEGIEIRGQLIIRWLWFWIVGGLLLAGLAALAWYMRRRHYRLEHESPRKELPDQIKLQLSDLQKYRDKYGQMLVVVLAIAAVLLFGRSLSAAPAEGQQELNPPIITLISKNISNEEIFYVGGKTEIPNAKILIYLQNLQTGETFGYGVTSDKGGDWLYRHDRFLLSGNYLLWAQTEIEMVKSPPGPQMSLTVRPTAIQFGSSRLSYENLYLIAAIVLLVSFIVLIIYIIFHGYHISKKRVRFMKEIKEAEDAVRRGFVVLRRDIQAELDVIKKAKLNKTLSEEEKVREEILLKDLEEVERYIGKEVFDIEKAEYND